MTQYFLRRDTSIAEAAKMISKSDCLSFTETVQEEFRLVKLNCLETHPLITSYLPQNLTEYALNKCRFNIALAFRDYKITKHEMGSYLVTHKTEENIFNKVKLIN
jgi:hypothetical protein